MSRLPSVHTGKAIFYTAQQQAVSLLSSSLAPHSLSMTMLLHWVEEVATATVGGLETETLCKKEFKNKKTRYLFNSR